MRARARTCGRGVLAATVALAGCGLGVGPYQPGRIPAAKAGEEIGLRHADARARQIDSLHGGEEAMYAFDGGVVAGVKQGASWSRATGGSWSDPRYFFELHGGMHETLADRVTLGVELFAAGYGTGQTTTEKISYVTFGGALLGKLRLTRKTALRGSAGPTYGGVERRRPGEMSTGKVSASGWRATAGIDRVIGHLFAGELILTSELQWVQTEHIDLGGVTAGFEGAAIAFELVLVGF